MKIDLIFGDAATALQGLSDQSVQCVITSPPYYSLRDYKVAGQLGLEETPGEYIEAMVAVFREVKRVLRADGTCWLNMGDSYARSAAKGQHKPGDTGKQAYVYDRGGGRASATVDLAGAGLKEKDLLLMPHRLALALQADGWWVRQDIVWAKGNPMPESVTDRPTRSHEYLFLLTKSARYYYDADAIREPVVSVGRASGNKSLFVADGTRGRPADHRGSSIPWHDTGAGRNRRSVWTINAKAYPGAHFATFPPALVEPCLLAGTSEAGCCPECGAPWKRLTEKTKLLAGNSARAGRTPAEINASGKWAGHQVGNRDLKSGPVLTVVTTGWTPTCRHAARPLPCTVLDPFAGSGTVGEVALTHGRSAILIELNPAYEPLIRARLARVQPPLPLAA